MMEFALPMGLGRRVRLWVDDLENLPKIPGDVARRKDVIPAYGSTPGHRRVAAEMYTPFGGSFHYGLLGVETSPGPLGSVTVVVPTQSAVPNTRYLDSLVGTLDDVIIGSTPEYAEAVVAAVRGQSNSGLPSGRLEFTVMGHGMIGSAVTVFETLAKALILLLMRSEQPKTADEAAELLRAT